MGTPLEIKIGRVLGKLIPTNTLFVACDCSAVVEFRDLCVDREYPGGIFGILLKRNCWLNFQSPRSW